MSTSSAERLAAVPQPGLAAGAAAHSAWAWAIAGLAVVGGTAALVHWDALVAAAATWIGSATYGYGMLVPPVVAVLLWQRARRCGRWRRALAVGPGADRCRGAPCDRRAGRLGAGRRAAGARRDPPGGGAYDPRPRRLPADRLPLLYLYLAVPLGDGLIAPLQELTAAFAVGSARRAGRSGPPRWPADSHPRRDLPRRRGLRRPALPAGVLRARRAARRSVLSHLVAARRCSCSPRSRSADRRQRPARGRAGADRAPERPAARPGRRSSDLWLRVHRPAARLPGRRWRRCSGRGEASWRRRTCRRPPAVPRARSWRRRPPRCWQPRCLRWRRARRADACEPPRRRRARDRRAVDAGRGPERMATGRGQSGCRGLAALSIGRSRRRSVRRLLLRAARGRRGGEPGAPAERRAAMDRPGAGAGSPWRGAGRARRCSGSRSDPAHEARLVFVGIGSAADSPPIRSPPSCCRRRRRCSAVRMPRR